MRGYHFTEIADVAVRKGLVPTSCRVLAALEVGMPFRVGDSVGALASSRASVTNEGTRLAFQLAVGVASKWSVLMSVQ
jgi:hypothetical protein